MSDMSMSDPTVVVDEKLTQDDVIKWVGQDWKRFLIYSQIVVLVMAEISLMYINSWLGWVPNAVKMIFNVGAG